MCVCAIVCVSNCVCVQLCVRVLKTERFSPRGVWSQIESLLRERKEKSSVLEMQLLNEYPVLCR